MKNGEGMNQK